MNNISKITSNLIILLFHREISRSPDLPCPSQTFRHELYSMNINYTLYILLKSDLSSGHILIFLTVNELPVLNLAHPTQIPIQKYAMPDRPRPKSSLKKSTKYTNTNLMDYIILYRYIANFPSGWNELLISNEKKKSR